MPLISVLLPAYNVAKYLPDAIDSILAQSFKDFELLILDDGSIDETPEIVSKFHDNRIKYIKQPVNLGLANNLNVGLSMAKGKYIARMDGDDISLPERFQIQFDFLEAHPDIDLCSCGLQMFGGGDKVWTREIDPEAIRITMLFYSPVLHPTAIWRRESFEKYKLYYNQDAFPAEDYDLWSRAIQNCKLVNIPHILYRYRIHDTQVTKTDDRVVQKEREIRINYLRNALPDMGENFYIDFVDRFISAKDISAANISKLRGLFLQLLDGNSKQYFFNQKILQKRLTKYYQTYLVRMIQANPDLRSKLKIISEMNFRTFFKWLIK